MAASTVTLAISCSKETPPVEDVAASATHSVKLPSMKEAWKPGVFSASYIIRKFVLCWFNEMHWRSMKYFQLTIQSFVS